MTSLDLKQIIYISILPLINILISLKINFDKQKKISDNNNDKNKDNNINDFNILNTNISGFRIYIEKCYNKYYDMIKIIIYLLVYLARFIIFTISQDKNINYFNIIFDIVFMILILLNSHQ